MATVNGPVPPMDVPRGSSHSKSRLPYQSTNSHTKTAPVMTRDPFYGHEPTAKLCAKFISHLFQCSEYHPSSNNPQARLPYFIAYALHRTKLHASVTITALVLLQRLKARFPTAKGSSGHRLFVSAFMIASKTMCDDTYSNKSWSIVAQNLFSLREINQMERELCQYLEWEVVVDATTLTNFEKLLNSDFGPSCKGPFPTYPMAVVSKRAARCAASASATPLPEPHVSSSPIPLGRRKRSSSSLSSTSATESISSDGIPETPEASYSTSTTPATTPSPPTPTAEAAIAVEVQQADGTRLYCLPDSHDLPAVHPLKAKMFARARPSSW